MSNPPTPPAGYQAFLKLIRANANVAKKPGVSSCIRCRKDLNTDNDPQCYSMIYEPDWSKRVDVCGACYRAIESEFLYFARYVGTDGV